MIGVNLRDTSAMLDFAFWQHSRPLVYVAYSGGSDSAVALDVTKRWADSRGVGVKAMAIDTGLSADGWRDMVTDHCKHAGVSLEIVGGDSRYDWYRDNVREYGFGYTPGHHVVYYRMLKAHCIQQHLKSVKRHRRDRVLYVTGVRRAESAKRATAKYILRHGSRVTVNAILDWSNLAKRNYLMAMCKWWSNEYYSTLGNSGDCQCGWTCNNRLSDLSAYPHLYAKITECESLAAANDSHRYGVRPEPHDASDDAAMPDDALCINCHQLRLL